jgi:hypothetical protein
MRSILRQSRTKALANMVSGHGNACIMLAKTFATTIGVPYYEDRITERFLGHRLLSWGKEQHGLLEKPLYRHKKAPDDAEPQETWPNDPITQTPAPMSDVHFLTEEVWSRDHWPNTSDDPAGAMKRLQDGRITGMYYHGPSMSIVLLHPGGLKIGVRATSIIHHRLGPDKTALAALAKLKKAE